MVRRSASISALVLLALGVCGCPDFSALEEGLHSYGQSPSLNSLLDLKEQGDGALDDAFVEPPDVTLPDLDISLEDLEGFTLVAVDPPTGDIKGKDLVMLVGSGFHDSMVVFFGEEKASEPFVVSSNYATVETPPHWPGIVDVRIVGHEGEAVVLPASFTYQADLLIESIEPAAGPVAGATPVEVYGTGFDAGCEVFFGGRKAPSTLLLDPFHIQTVSPPGHCGDAHIHVVCEGGNGLLKHAFHYHGLPAVESLYPAVVPPGGGIWVDVTGSSFTPNMSVLVNDVAVPWYDVVFLAPSHVRFKVPAGDSGLATVVLGTECGAASFDDRLVYGGDEGQEEALLGVVPAQVPACSGGFLTLALTSLSDPDLLTVYGNAEALDVVSFDEDLGSVDVALPAGPEETVVVSAAMDGEPLDGAFEVSRVGGPAIEYVTPGSGHVGGGTEVAIEGCGFPDEVEVRFGPYVALASEVLSDTTIGAVAPAGTPGPVDVSIFGKSGKTVLPNAFTYLADEPTLYLVSPNVGSVAGGTYVRFHGAGMPPNATIRIGDRACFDMHFVDSSLITARIPAGEVGTFDVHLEWPGGSSTLSEAFTYYDPFTTKSGTWGGPIEEALNVNVLDGSNGDGLPAAYVMLGDELQTPHQGYTDENGQITFSMPGLQGPVTVTAAKPGYTLYSVVHYDATNVTVYLSPVALPSSGGGSYTPMQAYVAGKVYGLDKYVVVPPGDCSKKNVDGPLCLPCETDLDCVVDGVETESRCIDIGDTGRYCVTECLQNTDCPDEFICAKAAFEITGCWPKGGERGIRCESSKGSMFGSAPAPGPGGVTNAHDIYFINAVTGEMAVVCYGGYTDPDTYQFVPTVMGIKRHVIVLNGDVMKDQDIHLNIPLTREARISFHDLPHHPNGIRKPYLILSLELGKEGYLDPPVNPIWDEAGGYYRVPALPAQMTGQLLGTTYSIYASVQSDTPYSMPYAVRMVEDVENLFGDGIMWLNGDETTTLDPPVQGDVVGISYRSDDDIYVATGLGELVHYNGINWTPAGLPFTKQGFTRMVDDPQGGLWVGGAGGDVWHFNGTAWKWIDTGISQPVRDLWAAGGKAVVVYAWMMTVINDFSTEKYFYAPSGNQLQRVWGGDFDDLYVLSSGSKDVLWNVTPDKWDALLQSTDAQFVDLDAATPDAVWVLSSPGKVLKFEGDSYEEYALPSTEKLHTVKAMPDGRVLVGAADGRLWSLEEGDFVYRETGSLQDLLVVAPSHTSTAILAGGAQAYNMGPFMAYPRILKPQEGEVFDFSTLEWEYWTPGATADMHSIILSSDAGYSFWSMMVDGEVTSISLPPIVKALGLNVIPDGGKRWNLTSALNPTFNIDYYSSSDLSIYRRISWSVDYVKFK